MAKGEIKIHDDDDYYSLVEKKMEMYNMFAFSYYQSFISEGYYNNGTNG